MVRDVPIWVPSVQPLSVPNIGHALHMRLFALTPSSLDDLKGSNQRTGLIVEGMPSGCDASDHPGSVVFGKRPQHFGKFVSCFLLRLK